MFIKRGSLDSLQDDKRGSKGGTGAREKTEEELYQDLLERKAAKLRKKEEQLELQGGVEQLEYVEFPNIMGWYFDGQFTKSFTLHEEYEEYFKDLEDELDAQKEFKIEETFSEKVARNFWPPVFHGGKYFRTRGVYLDFKEVKEDPPKESPRINFEKTRGILTDEVPTDKKAAGEVPLKLLLGRQKKSEKAIATHRNERLTRRKLIKKQIKLERELEYLNKPTMLGWYFDGFFPGYFQLNEEYATIFNHMEVDIAKAKQSSIKETFAEKAKRYFWPPDALGQFCFRTRGVYLDSKDVILDPPHTPPEIVLERRMQEVAKLMEEEEKKSHGRDGEEDDLEPWNAATLGAEEANVIDLVKSIDDDESLTPEEKAEKKRRLLLAFQKRRHKSRMQMWIEEDMRIKAFNKHLYYFDDQIPGFFKKRAQDRDKYYYDSTWDVWRIKRTIIYFPNDFYWDDSMGVFFPKDRTRPEGFYVWDPKLGIYRPWCELTLPIIPDRQDITPSDFYFDHYIGKWLNKKKAPADQAPVLDENGQRNCLNKTLDTPDDFFFDLQKQNFVRKVAGEQYVFDPKFGAWKQPNAGIPVKGSQKPIHFYWNEVENKFIKKDAPCSFFVWDGNNKFFRKKKPLHGRFHPKNWYWNEKKRAWQLKKFRGGQPLISRALYWRPDRDYDKPWLEYVGGFRDYHIEYDYDRLFDEEEGGTSKFAVKKPRDDTAAATSGKEKDTSRKGKDGKGSDSYGKKIQFSTSEPAVNAGACTTTCNKTSAGASTRPTSAPGPKVVTMGGVVGVISHSRQENRDDSISLSPSGIKRTGGIMKGSSPTQSESAFDEPLDRKTLKVVNLGTLITDTDLRKYFASVKKIVRPKKPGTDIDEDYAYLKFKTEEAAAAALRTMHFQKIRGLYIKLAYKLKVENETIGGHPQLADIPNHF